MIRSTIDFLCCPKCQGKLVVKQSGLFCLKCQKKYPIINSHFVSFVKTSAVQDKKSLTKWNNFYQEKSYSKKDEKDYLDLHRQLIEDLDGLTDLDKANFLEIGCGPMFLGQYLAPRCRFVIGIDFSLRALKLAQKMFQEKKIKNYLLIWADLAKAPLKKNTFDLVYGGGVIEHFQDTRMVLEQVHRVLKKGGVAFNTVPVFNLGAVYRQFWGNIPNVPILRPLAELIHLRLLPGHHLRFGYELSFLPKSLIDLHQQAGFKKVTISKFEIKNSFEYLPKWLRSSAVKLSKHRLFWPMIQVVAYKDD